jgi:transcriptional regulator with XRE-family HTH domain
MTQAELAARLGLGRTSVTNLESGRQNLPLSLLPDIANALGIEPLRLVALAVSSDSDRGGADTLAASVRDAELRRWAGQVIGGTLASRPAPRQPSRRTSV